MNELIYTDRNGNEFMVNLSGQTIEGIYTYADTSYSDSAVNVDNWKSKTNGVFIHCPANDIKKVYKTIKASCHA